MLPVSASIKPAVLHVTCLVLFEREEGCERLAHKMRIRNQIARPQKKQIVKCVAKKRVKTNRLR